MHWLIFEVYIDFGKILIQNDAQLWNYLTHWLFNDDITAKVASGKLKISRTLAWNYLKTVSDSTLKVPEITKTLIGFARIYQTWLE